MTAGISRVRRFSSCTGKTFRSLALLFLMSAAAVLLTVSSVLCSGGVSEDDLEDKSIAIMPVAVDSEISTAEGATLSNYVNAELDDEFTKKFDDSKIIGTITTQALLGTRRKTRLIDDIFEYYEESEEFDINQIKSIRSVVSTDFVILSLMEVEPYEVEFKVFLIDMDKEETLWESESEFERGSIVGMGSSQLKQVAKELVEVAIFRGRLGL